LEIEIATAGREGHDVALELLLCLGQALWTKLTGGQQKAYWLLVGAELRAGTPGEIDEDALRQKKALLSGCYSATSRRRLKLYGAASFAGTAAEYIHCLWHDVTIRAGPDFLPAPQLRRRLQLLSRWYPPATAINCFRVISGPYMASARARGPLSARSRSVRVADNWPTGPDKHYGVTRYLGASPPIL
jgi:hypothetical protein